MRILILGGDGMLGHQLFKHLSKKHEVKVTLRQNLSVYEKFNLFFPENTFAGIDVRLTDQLSEVFGEFQPQAIVNAVGIIKQRLTSRESIPSLEINSLFPHRLAILCKAIGARMIHLSTDCVFSGTKGNYREEDPSDAVDLYGKSKYLGELNEQHCITLRTSMIGRELYRKKSLLEWFLAQKGSIKGFKKAIFSGFTTQELSRIIEMILKQNPTASGIYHVSSDPISKCDLLFLINKRLKLPIKIIPDESFVCDRSLDSSRFRQEFNYNPPPWEKMVEELCEGMSDTDIYR
ncbi:MAG: SDR family oxidoreductase [Desulfobacterales bacterium]|nr:SDR family oxidoreductase [Desulfobacterales bacterium]